MTEDTLRNSGPNEAFSQRVEEEIDQLIGVLGGPYRKEPVRAAEERLGILLRRNQARLAQIIIDADSRERRVAAARMVLSLRREGIERALALATSDDPHTRMNALAAIPWPFDGNWTEGTHPYDVIEAIHESEWSDDVKVRVIVDIIRRPVLLEGAMSKQDLRAMASDAPMYMEFLALYADEAVPYLAAALRENAVNGRRRDKWLIECIALLGTDAVEAVLALYGGTRGEQLAAVAAVQALGEARDWLWRHVAGPGYSGSGWRYIEDRDVPVLNREMQRAKSVQPSRIDSTGFMSIARQTVSLLHSESTEVRTAAAKALGYFPDEAVLEPLVAALNGDDAKLASAAARALGCLPSADRVAPLVLVLENGSPAVRPDAHAGLVQLLTSYAQYVRGLRNRPPENLHPAFRNELPKLESLLATLREYGARIEAARKDVHEDERIPAKRREALGQFGWWDYLLTRIASEEETEEERRQQREERIQRGKEHLAVYPDALPAREIREEESKQRGRLAELRRRAKAFHEKNPEVSAPYRMPTPVIGLNLGVVMRELPEDRRYTEREMTAAANRVNARGDVAKRRLFEEWWMERDGREYWFTDRGRRAWKIERLLSGQKTAPTG